jgi:hypothetical protein
MDFPIKSVSELEKISGSVKWQYFEKLVAFIFNENGFDAKAGLVFRTGFGKRQVDVIARGRGVLFLVECKKWKSRSERRSALKSAVSKHLERCSIYAQLHPDEQIFPMLVTLLDDDINIEKEMPVVPIMKLNSFLQEYDTI